MHQNINISLLIPQHIFKVSFMNMPPLLPHQQIFAVQLPSPVSICGCGHQLYLPQCHLHPQLPEAAVHDVFSPKTGESREPLVNLWKLQSRNLFVAISGEMATPPHTWTHICTHTSCCLQLFTVRQRPDSEDTNSNRQEDDSEAAAGTKMQDQITLGLCKFMEVNKLRLTWRINPLTGAAEVPTSPQETATNPSKESHIGTDAEATSSHMPSDSNNVEASRAHWNRTC